MDGWRDIKLLAFDVDGVLTDGTIYYGPGGDAMKAFPPATAWGFPVARAAGRESRPTLLRDAVRLWSSGGPRICISTT